MAARAAHRRGAGGQEALFPRESAIAFGSAAAASAADLYRAVPGARGREIDLAVAATAICWDARLWTLNPRDFDDVPGLELFRPA